jgi:hypothetical protein
MKIEALDEVEVGLGSFRREMKLKECMAFRRLNFSWIEGKVLVVQKLTLLFIKRFIRCL